MWDRQDMKLQIALMRIGTAVALAAYFLSQGRLVWPLIVAVVWGLLVTAWLWTAP